VIARPQLLISVLLFSQAFVASRLSGLPQELVRAFAYLSDQSLAFRSDDFFDGPQIGKERLVSWHGSLRLIQPGDCNGVET
jgi:hypothetical protein